VGDVRSPAAAMGMLMALRPMIKVDPSLRDHVIMLLRKAMFNREVRASFGRLSSIARTRVAGQYRSASMQPPSE
jgi:hypothetical protein